MSFSSTSGEVPPNRDLKDVWDSCDPALASFDRCLSVKTCETSLSPVVDIFDYAIGLGLKQPCPRLTIRSSSCSKNERRLFGGRNSYPPRFKPEGNLVGVGGEFVEWRFPKGSVRSRGYEESSESETQRLARHQLEGGTGRDVIYKERRGENATCPFNKKR